MTRPTAYSVVGFEAQSGHPASVRELLDHCHAFDGRLPLGDHAVSALAHAELSAQAFAVTDRSRQLVAYAQATPSTEPTPTWTLDIAIAPHHRSERSAILDTTWRLVLGWLRSQGAHTVQWWCQEAGVDDHAVAGRHGLLPTRELHEMHVMLPTTSSRPLIATRTFDASHDEQALLNVNNLAFKHHHDQGNWTLDSLAGRFASEWFDPAGLLLHVDTGGTVLGFCWTKVHRSSDAPMGEIYVLAVRPSHHGRGLGRSLAEAGLHSLRARGIDRAMLFVDSTNTSARNLYERLGFTTASTTTAFSGLLLARARPLSPTRS